MRDPDRILRILNKLEVLWRREPDTRLCQFLQNRLGHHHDLFYVEDDKLEEILNKELAYIPPKTRRKTHPLLSDVNYKDWIEEKSR